jgi:hypothetical protein
VTPALQFDFLSHAGGSIELSEPERWKTSHQRATNPNLNDDIFKGNRGHIERKLTPVLPPPALDPKERPAKRPAHSHKLKAFEGNSSPNANAILARCMVRKALIAACRVSAGHQSDHGLARFNIPRTAKLSTISNN